jgi:hypothetical protein
VQQAPAQFRRWLRDDGSSSSGEINLNSYPHSRVRVRRAYQSELIQTQDNPFFQGKRRIVRPVVPWVRFIFRGAMTDVAIGVR